MGGKLRDPDVAGQDKNEFAGLYGHYLNEGPFIPTYKKTGAEVIQAGVNNSFVILGRDRDGHGGEGVGGAGGTGCGSIDMVVGLGGHDYKEFIRKRLIKNDPIEAKHTEIDPSFIHDAARIYITEKGEVDKYFGLAQGSEMSDQAAFKSAIALKSDHTRIIGREHVKIIAGKMRLEGGGTGGERNSGGGVTDFASKIDLIAGNYTDDEKTGLLNIFGSIGGNTKKIKKLQPIPKGDNLKELLEDILEFVSDLSNMASNNTRWLQTLISQFQLHVHESNVPFGPTTPPISTAIAIMPTWIDCWKNWVDGFIITMNVAVAKIVYLMPLFSTYINSRFVNTT